MRLVKPSFEILEQGPGLEGIYEAIERAGRTCYKSTRPEGQTAKDFVDRMIASQHYAMLEHGTVYLEIPYQYINKEPYDVIKYLENPYSRVRIPDNGEGSAWASITTNLRVLVENGWLEDFKYLCEPTDTHEKRITVRFTTDRGVSHEFVRHRVFSFAQESTRYCNYSKDKFGNELTFIIPSWSVSLQEGLLVYSPFEITQSEVVFMNNCFMSEKNYLELLKEGCTPQQARQVLPNSLKTELVMTGFVSDWQHFFDLRARGTTGAPHPDAKALAEPLMQEFIKRNFITE